MKIKIAPSILSADFRKLGEEVSAAENAGADLIHIDVMDGHFVPNITIGPLVVAAVRKATKLPIDVHLMIQNPEKFIDAFAASGSDIISVHAEACSGLPSVISKIKKIGVKPAVAINPATQADILFPVLDEIDMVLIMSVNPGFEGQKFMPEVLPKISQIRKKMPNLDIEVDGGINSATITQVLSAGANVIVAGSAVYHSSDYKKVISELRYANRI